MIDRATIQRVTDAADIVDVVKEFVTLRKAGVNYKGLCPFHDEKTPSFVVSPSKGLCKCFSCGEGGNAVHFIMKHEQLSYPEAIAWLGRKYGIEVRDRELTDEEKVAAGHRESLFVLNEWARDYFTDLLHTNIDGVAIGMAYFRSRGFRDDIIRKFQLGFALNEREALAHAARAKGFNPEFLEQTGLCYRTDDGRLLDRYHGRVIFPVHTVSGKVVAFGGRTLTTDKKVAKYVNSPESEIYSKSRELYGLYFAKHAIVKHNRCYLVEGYTDVISMHQSGIENVVSSSGTSLTEGQIRLLHRFTSNITILYDGDSAGIKASLRGIDMLLAEGMNIKVLLLPDGDDPDSFARKHNAQEYQAYIEEHQVDFIKFKTNLLSQSAGNDPTARATLVQDVVQSISVIPDKVMRQMYAHECAVMLSVSEPLIVNEVARLHHKRRTSGFSDTETAETKADGDTQKNADSSTISAAVLRSDESIGEREEETLIAAVIRYGARPMPSVAPEPSAIMTVAAFIASELEADGIRLQNPLFYRILEEAATHLLPDGQDSLTYFLAHPDAEISGLAARLGEERFVLADSQRSGYVPAEERLAEYVPRILHDYKHTLLRGQMKALLDRLRHPDVQKNQEECFSLMRQYKELAAIEQQFAQVLGDRVLGTP